MKPVACSVLIASLAIAPAALSKPAPSKPTAAAEPPSAPRPELLPDGRPKLDATEGLQSLEAAGYRIVNGQGRNLCGGPAPLIKFTYKDLNGDGFPEAIGIDNDKACYGGPFVTIVQRQRNGVWAWLFRQRGEVSFGPKTTTGWMDIHIKTKCDTVYAFDGLRYSPSSYCQADNTSNLPAALPTPIDFTGAFQAAGMVKKAGHWTGCADDENGFAQIENGDVRDLNQDGVNEVIISDYGGFCYGNTGQGFFIVTKTDGQWKMFYNSPGIPTFLPTPVKTPGGWPDIEIGGPGFCFPINRWNGKDYVFNRNHEYDKGACKRRGM